jgi:hypothetical protein
MANRDQLRQQRNVYQIVVQGQLDPSWLMWFEGLKLSHVESEVAPVTVIAGTFCDQAALRGVLTKLWDLGLTLISVTKVENNGE